MTDVFMSYAHSNKDTVRVIATNLESDGRDIWWDDELTGGEFYGATIEDEIEEADRVLVAWSEAARRSVWVRGEALEALDTRKLVQIQLDRSRLPVPFNALHAIDFADWRGERDSGTWKALNTALDTPAEEPSAMTGPLRAGFENSRARAFAPPLTMTENVIGGDMMSTTIAVAAPALSAVAVLIARADLVNAQSFTIIAVFAFVASALASLLSVVRLLRTDTKQPKIVAGKVDAPH